MDINSKLLQKNGVVAVKLARELITMKEGQKIETVADYAEKFNSARGTVQSAIALLKENKAIELHSRGHMGTFIDSINYEILWEYTGFNTLIGVMPLPYSKRYEGLATGLYNSINSKNFPFSLAYMRGAKTRIKALKDGRYDFAVVSKLAALESIKQGLDIDIVMGFGEYSYVNEHVLIFGNKENKTIKNGMKVGIDRSSIDICLLTINECKGKSVEFVELPYNQIITKVKNNEIDAAIWNIDEIIERKIDIECHSLNGKCGNQDTEAVIIFNKNNYGIKNIFLQLIDKDDVIRYQRLVEEEILVPNY